MYLIDTNIFLEILLAQEKKEICKNFLKENIGQLSISDFSLHSIGVILFRNSKIDTFLQFSSDVIPNVDILSLAMDGYRELVTIRNDLGLDFDDAYQFGVAQEYDLEIVTMDKDFIKSADSIKVTFL